MNKSRHTYYIFNSFIPPCHIHYHYCNGILIDRIVNGKAEPRDHSQAWQHEKEFLNQDAFKFKEVTGDEFFQDILFTALKRK